MNGGSWTHPLLRDGTDKSSLTKNATNCEHPTTMLGFKYFAVATTKPVNQTFDGDQNKCRTASAF